MTEVLALSTLEEQAVYADLVCRRGACWDQQSRDDITTVLSNSDMDKNIFPRFNTASVGNLALSILHDGDTDAMDLLQRFKTWFETTESPWEHQGDLSSVGRRYPRPLPKRNSLQFRVMVMDDPDSDGLSDLRLEINQMERMLLEGSAELVSLLERTKRLNASNSTDLVSLLKRTKQLIASK
jgi:hypothetical protein